MKIALIAPSSVPFVVGGAEKLWWGLAHHINAHTQHELELIKLPSPERNFWELLESYERFAGLDLGHFDAVISTKYPAWMVSHPNHVVYLQHRLRGLYDTWPSGLNVEIPVLPGALKPLHKLLGPASGVSRSLLPDIFGNLQCWREGGNCDANLTAFPGPLIRALVHKLDAIALAPGAIRRFAAISQTVARRANYFPEGAEIAVLPHPSNLEGLDAPSLGAEFVFTASRLDGPKRVDLIIKAYRHCRTHLPLVIAGDGPMAAAWRQLAAGDPRIRFVGRISDLDLVELYRRAALVVFVPFDEDMGLITLEAMRAGKPVITVSDSGGVSEFVHDGINGRIVPPEACQLGQAIDSLLADPDRLMAVGEAARASVAEVTWERTANALLEMASPSVQEPERLRLLVLNTFSVWPPQSGGQKRIFHLYEALASWADVTLLNMSPVDAAASERSFGHYFREIVMPVSPQFAIHEGWLRRRLNNSCVGDIATLVYWQSLGGYVQVFEELREQVDVVVASHCYLAPLIRSCWAGEVWYDAHNVEADMKAAVLGLSPPQAPALAGMANAQRSPGAGDRALQTVLEAEQWLVSQAKRVWAVSDADQQRLQALYGRSASSIELVPNGTRVPRQAILEPQARARCKQNLGLAATTGLAVFVGSNHAPNNLAVRHLLRWAPHLPDWRFVVVGSVCDTLHGQVLPSNLLPLGRLDEAELWALLASADVGLNPVEEGGGTNLKVLDYAAHGALVLSTPVGLRGGALMNGEHALAVQLEDFMATLRQLQVELPSPRHDLRVAAHDLVRQSCSWECIGQRVSSESGPSRP